jgi:hypothetical protein
VDGIATLLACLIIGGESDSDQPYESSKRVAWIKSSLTFLGWLTVPVSADQLQETKPSTSLLQRERGPRFLVRLAPRAPAVTAGSGDLPRAR